MITNRTLTEMLHGKRQAFIFMRGGRVQFRNGPQGTGPIVATSREAAQIVAVDLAEKLGKRVAIAEVGTVPGESLAGHVAVAVVSHGATGVFLTEDGQEHYFFRAPPIPDEDE